MWKAEFVGFLGFFCVSYEVFESRPERLSVGALVCRMMARVEYVVWKVKLLIKLAVSRALLMSAPNAAPMSASSSSPALGVAPGAGRRPPAIRAGPSPPAPPARRRPRSSA